MKTGTIILILYTIASVTSFLYASQYVWAGLYFIGLTVVWFKLKKKLI